METNGLRHLKGAEPERELYGVFGSGGTSWNLIRHTHAHTHTPGTVYTGNFYLIKADQHPGDSLTVSMATQHVSKTAVKLQQVPLKLYTKTGIFIIVHNTTTIF